MGVEELNFIKQKEKIINVLNKASKTNYYKQLFEQYAPNFNKLDSYSDFMKIPILTKELYEQNKFDMIDSCYDIDKEYYCDLRCDFNEKKRYLWDKGLYVKVTSGSTGRPIEIFKTQKAINREYMGLNLYRKRINLHLPNGNFIWIWPVNSYTKKYFYDTTEQFYRVNSFGWQYIIDEYSEETFEMVYKFIKSHEISWITASPSFLYNFAHYIEKREYELMFSYIECHSEMLYSWQSEYIEYIFNSKPLSVYSSNEIQFMAMQCKCGNMHVINNNVFIEILSNGNNADFGKVVATSLCSTELPFIRYELGDIGAWVTKSCNCGLETPVIRLSGFRENDMLICKNGVRFEPFVITDAILFLQTRFSLKIKMYFVYQYDYDVIYMYFQDDVYFKIYGNNEIKLFLSSYFKDVTKQDFKIVIFRYSEMGKLVGTKKYKYFMVGDKIETKHN